MMRMLKGCFSLIGLVVVIAVIAIIVVVVIVAGGGGDGGSTSSGGGSGGSEVVYKVTGAGGAKSADMTFTASSSMSISQENGERLPWSKTVEFDDEPLNFFSVSAQNNGGGKLTCSVTVDGEEVARNTSSGRFAVVSCDESSGLL